MNTSLTNGSKPLKHSIIQHDYILLDGSSSMLDKWFDSLAANGNLVSTIRYK